MRRSRPKIHAWAYPYGDANDPWPGDLAFPASMYWYRFDGQVWRLCR